MKGDRNYVIAFTNLLYSRGLTCVVIICLLICIIFDIKLSFSSRNLSEEQLNICSEVSKYVDTQPAKEKWQWWGVYKTEKIAIPDNLSEEIIFGGLDKALDKVLAFEKELLVNLKIE